MLDHRLRSWLGVTLTLLLEVSLSKVLIFVLEVRLDEMDGWVCPVLILSSFLWLLTILLGRLLLLLELWLFNFFRNVNYLRFSFMHIGRNAHVPLATRLVERR